MDRETAREQLKGDLRSYVEQITRKSKGASMYARFAEAERDTTEQGLLALKTVQAGSVLAVIRAGTYSTL